MTNIIRKAEIVRWANDTRSARSELPALIRGLIHATAHDIEQIDFPAYESVDRSGFDGDLLCNQGNAWVPDGASKWEVSVEKNPQKKANSDYTNSLKKAVKEVRANSTLVIVTARHWENKSAWQSEKQGLGEWQAVRAYDADDLEQWIEQAPAVAAWFGERLNLPVSEFTDHTSKWKALSSSTRLPLSPDTFLVSRKRSHERVKKWLVNSASYVGIVSPFPEDSLNFVCSVIEALDEAAKVAVCSQLAYVETHRAFRELLRRGGIRSVVVDPQVQLTQADIATAIERGIRVLHALPPYDPLPEAVLRLERVREHELAKELEKCGLPTVSAEQMAHDCGGSTTLLKSSLAPFATTTDTLEVSQNEHGSLRACLLLGGWDGQNEADKLVVEELAGKSYDDVEIDCKKWSRCRNPLLFSADGKWRLISKGDAWKRLSSYLPTSAFESAIPLAVAVLTDSDPAYELPDKERWLARVRGYSPTFSSTLKRHLAEILAFIGTFGDRLTTNDTSSPSTFSYRVVSEVTSSRISLKEWASLGSLLPLLAEASPKTYLESIESDLATDDPKLAGLFRERSGHPLIAGCDYTGLLWSLETLAWSPTFLPRVCSILLKLHHFHIPSNYANHPMDSLSQVLSCALPYTSASVDDRIAIIHRLLVEDEENAWSLLMSLLGQLRGGGSPMTSRPDWRDWASQWELGVTYADFDKQLDAVAEKVLEHVGANVKRWNEVFGILTTMPRTRICQALLAIRNLSEYELTDLEKQSLCKSIDEFVSLYRHHLENSKALVAEDIDALSEYAKNLQPVSLALRHAWLFEQWVDRHYIRNTDIKDAQKELKVDREQAISEILDSDGIEGVFELAKQSSNPFSVGLLLAELTGDQHTTTLIPGRITNEDWSLNLVLGFASHCHERSGEDWINDQLERCKDDNQKAWLLVMLPFVCATWDLVDVQSAEAKSLYWTRARHWRVDRDADSVMRSSRELIAVGRIAHAVDVVCSVLHDGDITLPVNTLLMPLEAILDAETELAKEQIQAMSDYEVGMVLTAAQNAADAPEDRLFKLEFNFLRMLGDEHQGSPVTLFRRLTNSPEFFVELLSLVFKSSNADQEIEEQLPENEAKSRKASAHAAYDLLHKWDEIPGTNNDGTIDPATLRDWINNARSIAATLGYLDVCDSQIGKLLSNAPTDSDGTWPCAAVRTEVEEIKTERLASGIYFGVLNSRGVVCRGEGGEQERELAAKYRDLAEKVRVDSPFISSLLDDLCQYYLREAKHWDATEDWER